MACSLLVACGDDDEDGSDANRDSGVDSGTRPDSGGPNLDAGLDSTVANPGDGSVSPDSSATFAPKVIAASISAGDDAFYGVAHDATGNVYATGKTNVSGSDYAVVVAKYSAAGALDTTFGTNGYAIKNVIEAYPEASQTNSHEQGRAVVVQASGKIVVAAQASHASVPADAGVIVNDTDVYLVRFNANGTPDTGFGINGAVQVDLGTAVVQNVTSDAGVTPTLRAPDRVWSLSQTTDGKLVIHGETRDGALIADGGLRFDSDFVLARFSADGVLDTSFSGDGVVLTDVQLSNASARSATVLANGSIVGVGYSSNTVLATMSKQNPILYKVAADGTPDPSFAATLNSDPVEQPGVWHNFARNDQANCEAYGAAPQGDKFVTLGYGPTPNTTGTGTDWVWFRFNADGTQDKTWGNNGETFQDPGGFGDNGRALITLPDNRVLGVGGGRAKVEPKPETPNTLPTEALIGVVNANGAPDTTFGPGGLQLLDLGGGRSDMLWSVDVSADKKSVAAVGEGYNAAQTDDRDGVVVIFPVP
ncbi:MAG: hypothetical protein ABW352_06910 [Polyangiales bacterium]